MGNQAAAGLLTRPDPIAQEETKFSFSPGLARLLLRNRCSLAFSSYQSSALYFLGIGNSGLHPHQTRLPRAMGIARSWHAGLVVAAGHQIIRFATPLKPNERVNDQFGACVVPRIIMHTGDVGIREGVVDPLLRVLLLATRFN